MHPGKAFKLALYLLCANTEAADALPLTGWALLSGGKSSPAVVAAPEIVMRVMCQARIAAWAACDPAAIPAEYVRG